MRLYALQKWIAGSILCTYAFGNAARIQTPFGSEEVSSPLIEELLASPALARLHGVDQSGITRYFTNLPAFSRFDHSLGVYMLLKRFNAPMEECIAGLLHDASHTVFSHVGDFIYRKNDTQEQAYQDSIHEWYLSKQQIAPLLEKHSLTLTQLSSKDPQYCALEQPLPDLCADRIEYNLHTALLFKLLSQSQIDSIVNDLRFEGGKWFFVQPSSAKTLAELSLFFTKNLWASAGSQLSYYLASQAIRRALEIGILSEDDIHFSTDTEVLSKLEKSSDPSIKQLLKESKNPLDHYSLCPKEKATIHIQAKFRGIDPLIQQENSFVCLTETDAEFKASWTKVKEHVEQGLHFSPLKKSE